VDGLGLEKKSRIDWVQRRRVARFGLEEKSVIDRV